jgi:hypothetical protein
VSSMGEGRQAPPDPLTWGRAVKNSSQTDKRTRDMHSAYR